MLKVFIGVVRFPDDRDFIIFVDGEPQPVEEAVQQVIREIWGDGAVELLAHGVDFVEFVHANHRERGRPDGYVLQCEVASPKRIGFAVQYARRLHNLEPGGETKAT